MMEGADQNEIIEKLRGMGYTPISVESQKSGSEGMKTSISLFGSGVSSVEKILFTRQLATLLKAGVPLIAGLDAVGEQAESSVLRNAIIKMKDDIKGGASLSQALSKHPKIFSPLYISMVKAGEASSLLDHIMESIAALLEYDAEVRTKIKTAVRYPMITFGTLVIAFFVLVTFVIPKFANMFSQFQMKLPLMTRALILINNLVHNWWFIVIPALIALVIIFVRFINTPFGRRKWDWIKIKSPVFGPLLFKLYMVQFSRNMSLLLSSGVNLLYSLDLTSDIIGNVIVSDAIKVIRNKVNEGSGLAAPMKASKLFTPIIIQMVSIGEETGRLDELLMKAADHYNQQATYTMNNLTTLIEPLFVFVLGFMVLSVGLGIFLPMWNLVYIYKR